MTAPRSIWIPRIVGGVLAFIVMIVFVFVAVFVLDDVVDALFDEGGKAPLLVGLVGVARAAEWLYTARVLDGVEGARAGLFNEALPGDEVLPRALEIARAIAANGPLAVRLTKKTLRAGLVDEARAAALREAEVQAATVDSDDGREGIAAALERRSPRFVGR